MKPPLRSPHDSGARGDLRWLDRMKAIALLWVIADHVVEQAVGGVAAGNLTSPWPPLAIRLAQFAPVGGAGLLTWPLTLLRDLSWFGDQGVTVLFLLSGFGLAYGAGGGPLGVRRFYGRRLARIYPTWWGAHLLFWPTGFFLANGLSSGDWRFFASMLGIRATPSLFYYFAPAWWYVGTLLQLYALFPLIHAAARRFGASRTAAGCVLLGCAALATGVHVTHGEWTDLWQRGVCAVTRLPEFGTGVAIGMLWRTRGTAITGALCRPGTLAGALAVYGLGTAASFFVPGEAVAPYLLGVSSAAVIFALARVRAAAASPPGTLDAIGRRSYAIYLVHQPFVVWFVPVITAFSAAAAARFAFGTVAALVATALASVALERLTAAGEAAFARVRRRRGLVVASAVSVGLFALVVVALPVSADLAIARVAPEEIEGWGERASLVPDATFGWTLRPSSTTHLHWETYDYTVTANALGFPGPAFAQARAPGTLRVFVTGDAFSSAEGVDTDASWPRLLQSDLAHRLGRPVEVLNFAVTGYGPRQEAAVVRRFVPRFRPDVVLVEMFANDVDDVLHTDDDFRRSIGFALPPQTGWKAIVTLQQLRTAIRLRVVDPLVAAVRHEPTPDAVSLGGLAYVTRGRADYDGTGVSRAIAAYREIERVARAAGAKVVVAFVPPAAAICRSPDLAYEPGWLDVTDPRRYDAGAPVRRAERITSAAGVRLVDLSGTLRAERPCPYARHNMHLTKDAQTIVGAALAESLAAR